MRALLAVWLAVAALWADGPFAFHEARYVYGIDTTLEFAGTITFDAAGMQIDYTAPQPRRILFDSEHLRIYDGGGKLEQEVDLEAEPGMRLYMQFLLWLYRGDLDALAPYFTVTQIGDELHLDPLSPTDKVVASVKVRRDALGVRRIKTTMSNHDAITIDIER